MNDQNPTDAVCAHARLVAALRDPRCYPHPVARVEVLQTHISTVLLAGEFAYKLKKPVAFDFLDFTSLERRRHFCEEELRLNRRTAPGLYLDVVAITGDAARPSIGGGGPVLDHAVRMRAFDEADLLDRRARAGLLTAADIDRLAARVAAFHRDAPVAAAGGPFGAPAAIGRWAQANLDALMREPSPPRETMQLQALADWSRREFESRTGLFSKRLELGFVRECHGDLHLGNIAQIGGEPLPFDCIEFNPELRWIDVISDVAFAFMDLLYHGLDGLGWRFLNAYLEASGDYEGLAVLPYYGVYRALVRANVARIRAGQPAAGAAARARDLASCERHLELAQRLAAPRPEVLAITCGVSGSGKTLVAGLVCERLGAVRTRSDVERKRLFGLDAREHAAAAPGLGIYDPDASRRTYERLAGVAERVLDAGYPVVVDAAFLARADRAAFAALARARGARFWIIACEAPARTLSERVRRRAQAGDDASDATAAVLARQLETREVLTADERALASTIATGTDLAQLAAQCERLAARLAG